MKQKNRKKRLENRIAGWESIRASGGDDKKKMVNKSQFTKPGSMNK